MKIQQSCLPLRIFVFLCGILLNMVSLAQTARLSGKIASEGKPIEFATIFLQKTPFASATDTSGHYEIIKIPAGKYIIQVTCIGFDKIEKFIEIKDGDDLAIDFDLINDKKTLNEIVVTGVTRATLIRENPVSIVSISAKALAQSNENNIIDALVKNAPGLTAVKTGPNISKPFIRGLGYNRVLTLYDGVRQEGQQWGDEHGIEVDGYGIERAEVIKGPASLMYGSDALAGVVSLFPFIPNEQDGKIHGKFTSEYQSNNNLIGNGIRLSMSNKHWLYSVRGAYRIAKNYTNALDGRVYNTGFEEKNLSALIGYQSKKGYTHLNFTLYDNLQGIPDGSRDSISRKFTLQTKEGAEDNVKNRPVLTDEALNSYTLSPLHQHIQHYRIYTHNYYEIGKGDLDLLLAFQQNVRREYNHPTLPSQAGLYVQLNTLNYGLRYNIPKISLKTSQIETAIGINGMAQNNQSKAATDFPIPNYDLLDAGAYMHLKWKYVRWTVSGGIRYDIRNVGWNNFYVKNDSTGGFDVQANAAEASTAYLQYPEYTKTFGGISSSLGLTYQVNEKISLKMNVARGYRAPSIPELASNGLDPGAHIVYLGNRNFVPEFSLQEDLGVNARFKNTAASLSIFNNDIQNYIYISQLVDANNRPLTDAQGNRTFQYQQSTAQLFGLEASFSLQPKKWESFSFDNSLVLTYGYNRNPDFKNKGTNGEFLPFIPPIKWMSGLTLKIKTKSKLFTSLTPKAEFEYNAAQNRYLALQNTETMTAAFSLINIGLSTEISYYKDFKMQLQCQINNLLDNTYQSNLNRLKYFEYYNQSPNGNLGMYNMGRNICVKIILPF